MTLVADVTPVVMPAGKPVLVRLTNVPPLVAPEVGEIAVTVGTGAVLLTTSESSSPIFPGGYASSWALDAGA
jgi:hypothetical protein